MKTESRPKAAPQVIATTSTIVTRDTDTTAYIMRQAIAPWTVRTLDLDFRAEVRYWMAVYAKATR